MSEILKHGLTLFLITAIAALSLGVANQTTHPIIEKQEILANNQARQEILPEASDFESLKSLKEGVEIYRARQGAAQMGYTVKTKANGYGGEIELITGIKKDGTISKVSILSMKETPGLGTKTKEQGFIGQFEGKASQETFEVVKGTAQNDQQISAVTGATISSKAVTEGVNQALEAIKSIE